MGTGFQLDASKHIDKKRTGFAETWGLVDKNEEGLAEISLTQNIGQAFEEWETNAKASENMDLALQELATKTALQEAELNSNKTKEIEDLKIKAALKNWSDDKLSDKIAKVEEKYEKLKQTRIALVEKEKERIRMKSEAAHQSTLDAKAKKIDTLLDNQDKDGLLEINLKSTSHNTYDKPKTKEDYVNKMCLSAYSGEYYKDINRYLRTGKNGMVRFEKKRILASNLVKKVYRGIEKFDLKKDMVATRNSDMKGLLHFLGMANNTDIKKADDLIKALKENPMNGHIGMDKGFFSTTLVKGGLKGVGSPGDKNYNPSFGDMQVEYRILTPKGTSCAYVAPISFYKGEKELLIQAGSAFRLVKIKTSGSWKGEDDDDQGKAKKKKIIKDKKIIVYLEVIQKKKEKKAPEKQ